CPSVPGLLPVNSQSTPTSEPDPGVPDPGVPGPEEHSTPRPPRSGRSRQTSAPSGSGSSSLPAASAAARAEAGTTTGAPSSSKPTEEFSASTASDGTAPGW